MQLVITIAALVFLASLMVLLHLLSTRRIARLGDALERQRRLLESLSGQALGASALRPAALPPQTERHTPRSSPRLPDPSPRASRIVGEPSPRSSPRLQELSPRSTPRLAEDDWRGAMARNPEITASWTPTHRITFTPDKGRPENWLVMIGPAPYGHRVALTHSEWAAGVTPAWHCTPDGVWTCRGLRTPEGERGKVAIDEMPH